MRIPYRNKLLLKRILRILGITLAVLAVCIVAVIIYADSKIVYDRNGAHLGGSLQSLDASQNISKETVDLPTPEIIYLEQTSQDLTIANIGGYYISTAMLQAPEKVLQQLKTISPCAVIMELKSIFGNFYYSTAIGEAKTASVDISIVDEIITYLREHGFYMIASVAAFSDTNFALNNQDCGLPLNNGALWMDENSCYWLDPASDTVISYLAQITRELATLGFSEVAFSDFRFPVSSNIYYESDKTTAELIKNAAQQLTNFFKGSNVMVSFLVNDTQFPVAACNGRLYVTEADGSKIERFTQAYGSSRTLTELVFLANSRDTRFDEIAVLRPLLSLS